MSITIEMKDADHFASVEIDGDWNPQNGITNGSFSDLIKSIFENKRYIISGVETLSNRIRIKYEDRGEPAAFVFHPKSDFSRSFSEPHMALEMNKLQNSFDRVESSTVGSLPEIRSAVQDARNIQVLWLRGHGSPTTVAFGEEEEDSSLTVDNIEKYLDIFNRVDLEMGVIFLDSCCDGDTNLIAEKIHRLTGRKVCANEYSSGYKGKTFLVRGENNQFILQGIGANGKIITTIFHKNQRWRYANTHLELIKDQGYALGNPLVPYESTQQYIEKSFKNMPIERLISMHEQDKTNPDLAYLLGQSYLRQNNKTKAIEFLQLAVDRGFHLSKTLTDLQSEDEAAATKRWNAQLLENLGFEYEKYMELPMENRTDARREQLVNLFRALPLELRSDAPRGGVVWKMKWLFELS
jgi:hypothetical protein